MLVYRAADTPKGKMVDSIRGIKIVAGQDLAQDDDMSRQEYHRQDDAGAEEAT